MTASTHLDTTFHRNIVFLKHTSHTFKETLHCPDLKTHCQKVIPRLKHPHLPYAHRLHSLLKSAPMDKYLFLSSSSWKCVELGFCLCVCSLHFPSSACTHCARVELDRCVIRFATPPIEHMFPHYLVLKVYANVTRQKGRRLAISFSAWWRESLQIPRQRAAVSYRSCSLSLRAGLLLYHTPTHTYTDTHTCIYAHTNRCKPLLQSLPFAHLHKVNLFTVIFSEWFAIIGSVDEGQSLWGAVSVFRDLICFQALCLQLRKANVTRKPQKWKFVWTY